MPKKVIKRTKLRIEIEVIPTDIERIKVVMEYGIKLLFKHKVIDGTVGAQMTLVDITPLEWLL